MQAAVTRIARVNCPTNVLSTPQAYLAGLTFALAASPCSTPVLATLLAFVSASADPVPGGLLLLTYTSGCGPAQGIRLHETLS